MDKATSWALSGWGFWIAVGAFLAYKLLDSQRQAAHQHRRERDAQAAELRRLRERYPEIASNGTTEGPSLSQLKQHDATVLEAEAKASRRRAYADKLEACASASEMRQIAHEFGDTTINRRAVLRRSNWQCGICGKGIRKSFAWDPDDERCGTVDHIRPISKGGEHEWHNVQASHWGCNKSKGNRWP